MAEAAVRLSTAPPPEKDAYSDLLSGTRALKQEQRGVREQRFSALEVEAKDELLFEFEVLLKAAEKDSSPKVRTAAIYSLFGAGGAVAFDPVLSLLKDHPSEPEIREAALRALKSFTGQDFGPDVPKWDRWWRENRSRYEGS